jgi:putative transposase
VDLSSWVVPAISTTNWFTLCLNEHLFANLNEARQIIEEWRIDYNTNRPHTSLNGLTPTEFATSLNRGENQNRPYL